MLKVWIVIQLCGEATGETSANLTVRAAIFSLVGFVRSFIIGEI